MFSNFPIMNRYFYTKQVLLIKMVLTIHNWHMLGFCRISGWKDRWYLWTFGVDSGNNNAKFQKLSLGVEGPGRRSSSHGHLTAGEGEGGANWETRMDIYIHYCGSDDKESTMQETWVPSLGWEDPLEEGTTTHSSILAWRIHMDREAWRATVHGVAKSWTWLSD